MLLFIVALEIIDQTMRLGPLPSHLLRVDAHVFYWVQDTVCTTWSQMWFFLLFLSLDEGARQIRTTINHYHYVFHETSRSLGKSFDFDPTRLLFLFSFEADTIVYYLDFLMS